MIRRIDNSMPRNGGLVRRGSGFRVDDSRWSGKGVRVDESVRRQRASRRLDKGPAVVEVNRIEGSFDKPISGRFGVYQEREMEPLGQYIDTWV